MKNINSILQEKARTSIFIAHRLRTVVEAGTSLPLVVTALGLIQYSCADLIVVLRDGRVVEQGSHEELLRKGGLYHSMWVEQASDAYVDYDSEKKEVEEVPEVRP